jgi:hypothetical protein
MAKEENWRALVNAVMNLRVLQNAEKLSSTADGLSSPSQIHRVSYISSGTTASSYDSNIATDSYVPVF